MFINLGRWIGNRVLINPKEIVTLAIREKEVISEITKKFEGAKNYELAILTTNSRVAITMTFKTLKEAQDVEDEFTGGKERVI